MARRRLARRARRALLWWAAGFAAFQLALTLAVERGLADVRDPEFTAKLTRLRARQAEAPGRPLVLVLGSSRTKLALQAGRPGTATDGPPALVFNFGLSGCGPMLELVCLRRLLAVGVRPDLLVAEVVPLAFNERDGVPVEENWLDTSRLSAAEVVALRSYYSQADRLLHRWTQARFLPCTRYQAEFRGLLTLEIPGDERAGAGLARGMDGHGWQPHHLEVTSEQRRFLTEYSLRQYADALADFRLARRPARALTDLLGLCRREGIPAALVLMPEAGVLRRQYPAVMEAGVGAFLAGLRRDWGVPVIDARAWVADAGFWDAHHVLPVGAAAFTERFEREVVRPLLEKALGTRHWALVNH
jgi:hypothetical protein